MAIKAAPVSIPLPQRRGAAVTEISKPPKGEELISWVLLTSLFVPDFELASEKVNWYATGFVIETWDETLKSGFMVERCRLGRVARLTKHLALCSALAVLLMNITYLARQAPTAPPRRCSLLKSSRRCIF